MKLLAIMLLVLGASHQVQASRTHSNQCRVQCTRMVKRLIEESTRGISTSYGEKQNNRLGDSVGVALLKIYNRKEISNPRNIKIFLPVIRAAFLYPDLISNPENKTPTVTLGLLRALESKVTDSSLKKEITDLINWLLYRSTSQTPQPNNENGVIYEVDPHVKHTGISHTVSGGLVSLSLV